MICDRSVQQQYNTMFVLCDNKCVIFNPSTTMPVNQWHSSRRRGWPWVPRDPGAPYRWPQKESLDLFCPGLAYSWKLWARHIQILILIAILITIQICICVCIYIYIWACVCVNRSSTRYWTVQPQLNNSLASYTENSVSSENCWNSTKIPIIHYTLLLYIYIYI